MSKSQIIKKSPLVPTVLVSNGISYLGIKLCESLLEKGARVVVLDSVDDEIRRKANQLLSHENFALFNADPDIGVPENIQSVDYIYQMLFPDGDLVVNAGNLVSDAFGTKSLLDLAVFSKAKFALVEPLFTVKDSRSSEQVYSYDKNSQFLRSLVWDYIDRRKLDGRVVRVCSIYGPGMSLESPEGLPRLVRALLGGDPLRIYGEGATKSHYLHIDEAVDGLAKALFYKRTSSRIFKLCSDESHADLEIAFILRSLADSNIKMEYVDQEFPIAFSYDTALGEQVPRWVSEKTLESGLKNTLKSFSYSVNFHSFKPAQVISNKLEENVRDKGLFTLSDLKDETEGAPSDQKEEQDRLSCEQPKRKKLCLHFLSLFQATLKVPKIKFPKISSGKVRSSKKVVIPKLSGQTKNFPANSSNALSWRSKYAIIPASLAFLFFLGAPAFIAVYSSIKAYNALQDISLTLPQLQTKSSQESARVAFANFHRSKTSFQKLEWVFRITGQTDKYYAFGNLLDSSAYFSGALYRTAKALSPFSTVWEVFKPNTSSVFSGEDFEYSEQEMLNARKALDLALVSYELANKESFPSFISDKVSFYGSVLSQANDLLNNGLLVVNSLPNVLGVNGKKEYLLLFQNSNEIRPTGGFIGSYAMLSLENGKIKDLYIDDIYNPDGQIDTRKIVSAVPDPIKEFLQEDTLHIRNANWSPDFPASARTIEDLFFKLDGHTFDGLVALDLNFVKLLLEVTGPVYLASYNEEINAKNLYERAQYHSEFDYQEGISEKRGFLTVLGGKLLESVFSLETAKAPFFVDAVSSSLSNRGLQIYLKDPVMATFLRENRWDGAQIATGGDYLMVVNANLGGTKANYFVENAYSYSVTSDTRDGLLRSKLDLSYKHNGENDSWPGGPYTDYVRVFVPLGSLLNGASLTRSGGESRDILRDSKTYVDGNYTVFASSFVLQPGEEISLEYIYDLPETLSLKKEDSAYALYWQKQAGTNNDIFRFDFRGPFGTEIVSYKPINLAKEKNIGVLEGQLNSDLEVGLSLK